MPGSWREDRGQRTWLGVGGLFFVFYFAEAFLFWGPNPRFVPPASMPLLFWGTFGVALSWVVTRPVPGAGPSSWWDDLQSWVLGLAITAGSVGSAFVIIRRSGDVILGHVVLLFVLGQAGLILGAMAFNPGWLLAAVCWIGAGGWILWSPAGQDYVLGGAVGMGLILVGLLRQCWVPATGGHVGD